MPISLFEPLIIPAPLSGNYSTYSVQNSFYSTQAKTWYTCREQFHGQTTLANMQEVYFGGGQGDTCFTKANDIASMLRELEFILNIDRKQRSRVSYCHENLNKDDSGALSTINNIIVHIKVSPFWNSDIIRAYFFTIAIKAINLSNAKTLIERLMAVTYAHTTSRAIARFLAGHTLYTSETGVQPNGWVNYYGQNNIDRANALKSPHQKADLKYFRRNKPFSNLTNDQRDKLETWVQKQEKSYNSPFPKFHFN